VNNVNEDLLQINSLKTHFATTDGIVRAVDGVNLRIAASQAVGLVGESGSGKSMTALSIMRLVPPPGKILEGQVLLKGKDLLRLSEEEMRSIRGKEISMIFQDPMTYLNPVMKIGDQIAESLLVHQCDTKKQAMDDVAKLLERVQIHSPKETANSYPHQLSGGMRQRVLIAIAIACNPSLLIADEPTTALDATLQVQILDLLKTLAAELKISVLLITHDLGIVADICDFVNVMYAGRILECADVFSLFEDPKHPYTKGLLASALSIDEFKEKLVTIDGIVPNLLELPQGCKFHPRCQYATVRCRTDEPRLVDVGDGRMVACWLFGG
jgi:oligopeptide/dipeptide ABC transporter ATP-binding protein